ncbi:hypothetical protein LCGC14_1268400 [marine sediment metagenome]|uniref:DUF1565 domain-containing protein n=1 Tax=marine sediment metagenome TaxID=412755 RepID=A0A0F9L0L3_9ZZZZ|nr:DUF1565 domain-containing protein [Desulfobacterales bacterium]
MYYYVDHIRGADSNDGTEETPFATIAKALSMAELARVCVAKGNYVEYYCDSPREECRRCYKRYECKVVTKGFGPMYEARGNG